MDVHVIGQMDNSDGTFESANRIYDTNGIAPTMITCSGGGLQPKIVASRGRGENNTQQLEVRNDDVSNAITTVSKDCMVMEPQVLTPKRTEYGKAVRKQYEAGEIQESRHKMTELEPRTDGVSNTLTSVQKDNLLYQRYAIRKLTARECFRLMAMSDEDYDKAASVVSESQRYRAAGDSIVVTVLMAIFSQLNIQGMPMWNDMTNDERYRMIGQ